MFPILEYLTISNIVLGLGILNLIVGIPVSFSKKERERVQKRVVTELPERSAITGAPEALRSYQRRGYIMLAAGVILVIIWFLIK